jgi:hypothetical protein
MHLMELRSEIYSFLKFRLEMKRRVVEVLTFSSCAYCSMIKASENFVLLFKQKLLSELLIICLLFAPYSLPCTPFAVVSPLIVFI